MRRIRFLFFAILFSFPLFAQYLPQKDGTAIDIFAVPKEKRTKNGNYTEHFPEGNVRLSGKFKKYCRVGEWKAFYRSGQLYAIGFFVNDSLDGKFTSYFTSGHVKEEGTYRHGKRYGPWSEYDPSGTISRQMNYDSNGNIRGVKKVYWENTSQLKEWSFTDSSGFETITRYNRSGQVVAREGRLNGQYEGLCYYYENADPGKKMNGTDTCFDRLLHFHNGTTEGLVQYYTHCQLTKEQFEKNGRPDSVTREYYENGKLKLEGYYADGKKNGVERQYDTRGNLWDETIYKDGLRNGKEQLYDSGKLAHIIWWSLGERDSSLSFYPDGKLEVRYRRVPGRNGGEERIVYFPNGKISSSTMQLRGVKDGACKSWYENGKQRSSVMYSSEQADGEYFAWNPKGILVLHAWADHGVDTLEYVFSNSGQRLSPKDTAFDGQLRRNLPQGVITKSDWENRNQDEEVHMPEPPPAELKTDVVEELPADPVFVYAERMPEFPASYGTPDAYFKTNLVYPQKAKEANMQGTVYVSFVVQASGEITDVKVVKGVPGVPEFSAEAIRVVAAMPNWKPGMMNGRPVAVQLTIPVKFRLD